MSKVTWTSSAFLEAKEKIARDLRVHFPDDSREYLACLQHGHQGKADASAQLMNELIYVFLSLEFQSRCPLMSDAETRKVYETGERILRAANIDYSRSNLSFLYQQLYHLRALIRRNAGFHDESAWLVHSAEHLSYRPDEEQRSIQEFFRAQSLLRLGHASVARSGLLQWLPQEPNEEQLLLIARCEWLCGHTYEAIKYLRKSGKPEALSLLRLVEAVKTQDYRSLGNQLRRDSEMPQLSVLATMWLYVPGNNTARTLAMRAATFRRKYGAPALAASRTDRLLDALEAIEQCYDNSSPLITRLNQLGAVFAERRHLPEVEHELMVLAAGARFAIKYSQAALADMLISEYSSMSARLVTEGYDVFSVLADMSDRTSADLISTYRPGGKLKRTARVAGLLGKGASMWTMARLRGLVATEEHRRKIIEKSEQDFGEYALAAVSELKGGFLKLGQIIAGAQEAPPELRAALTPLYDRSEMTDPAVSKKLLEQQLGAPIEKFFSEWSDMPFAVGSIGQVFRARTINGEDVAVKIQHPGIEQVIKSDCEIITWIKPVLKRYLPRADHDGLLKEVKERITDETDYLKESYYQQIFASRFAGDEAIVIPKVYPELSGQKVLTTAYVEGKDFASFCEEADQQQRNQAAVTILRMFCSSLFGSRIFNADPHPGNYLFLNDGKVAFVDFGCSKAFSPSYVDALFRSVQSVIIGDKARNRQSWIDLGHIPDPATFDFDALYKLFRTVYGVAIEDKSAVFDRKLVAAISAAQLGADVGKMLAPPPDSAMLLRFTWGVLSVLAQLEPELNFHRLAMDAMNRYSVTDESPASSTNAISQARSG